MTKTNQTNRARGGGGAAATAGTNKWKSSGPHKGKNMSGKRKLSFNRAGGGSGGGGRGGGRGNTTAKESAAAGGYRKGSGRTTATPKPFMMDGEIVSKLDQR